MMTAAARLRLATYSVPAAAPLDRFLVCLQFILPLQACRLGACLQSCQAITHRHSPWLGPPKLPNVHIYLKQRVPWSFKSPLICSSIFEMLGLLLCKRKRDCGALDLSKSSSEAPCQGYAWWAQQPSTEFRALTTKASQPWSACYSLPRDMGVCKDI